MANNISRMWYSSVFGKIQAKRSKYGKEAGFPPISRMCIAGKRSKYGKEAGFPPTKSIPRGQKKATLPPLGPRLGPITARTDRKPEVAKTIDNNAT